MSPLAERMTPIASRLGGIRGSIRSLFALDGSSRLLLALAAFIAVTFMIDWTFILPREVRLVLLAGGLVLAGWIIARRLAYPLSRRVSDDDLAIIVERHYPELNDRLISAIQLAREPVAVPEGEHARRGATYNSPELVEALINDAAQAASAMDFGRVVVGRHVGKIAAWAALVVLLLGAGAVAKPAYASIYLQRIFGGSVRWPQRTYLTVLDFKDGRRVMPRGDDLTVAVEYSGIRPSRVVIEYRFKTGERDRGRMTEGQNNRFQFQFTRVTGPFEFTVSGGDASTDPHSVDTVNPPSVETVRVFYEYPPYMRKASTPPDRPETTPNVVAPFHTKVRFEAVTNEDLKSAGMTLGLKGKERSADLPVGPDPDGRPRVVSGGFEVVEAFSEYSLQIHAANGLSNRDPIKFTIKGLEDRAPEARVLDPLGDEFVTELCERPLEIETRDDHGISRILLRTRVLAQVKEKARDWADVEFTREQNSRDYGEALIRSQYVLNIAALQLQAGDHVEFKVVAEDFKDVGKRNVYTGKTYKLSIVSVGTLEKELHDAIEKIKMLLKAQKTRQENGWNRSTRLIDKYGGKDELSLEEQGEVRQAGLEQLDITSKLDTARKDIRQIMRRGIYNKIFNESAASKLQGAIDEVDLLVGDANDATKPGSSRVAGYGLDQAARLKSASDRARALRDAQNLQSAVAAGIQRAIDYLDKWSSYQEVIRLVRELFEAQKKANDDLKKGGGKDPK